MIVYPAIDLRGGQCVRLVEGDFDRETAFDADPAEAAKRWADAGAEWLHVVDLDGARTGEPVNGDAIRRIRHAIDIPIQLGGGLRMRKHLDAALDLGIDRVILGTAAIADHALVREAVGAYGDRVAVGLDARDGMLAAAGWLEQTDVSAIRLAELLREIGVQHFIVTDISRDGTLKGPNLGQLAELVEILGHGVIASGGVGTIDDIGRIAETGADGSIVGRALYDGRVRLEDAIDRGRRWQHER
ncbi:MAG: 1-(5-phosphoribosyl)-5-[(5-phosphoribosylamino)methylideneamino]imidazole-4-carboxamide isomerase [Thermomicrobiales bacterium]